MWTSYLKSQFAGRSRHLKHNRSRCWNFSTTVSMSGLYLNYVDITMVLFFSLSCTFGRGQVRMLDGGERKYLWLKFTRAKRLQNPLTSAHAPGSSRQWMVVDGSEWSIKPATSSRTSTDPTVIPDWSWCLPWSYHSDIRPELLLATALMILFFSFPLLFLCSKIFRANVYDEHVQEVRSNSNYLPLTS